MNGETPQANVRDLTVPSPEPSSEPARGTPPAPATVAPTATPALTPARAGEHEAGVARHLAYLERRMRGDADEATRMAQVDRHRVDWWRGFAVACAIAGGIARIALERLDTEALDGGPDPA